MKFKTIIDGQALDMDFSNDMKLLSVHLKDDMKIDWTQLSLNSYSLLLDGKSHFLTTYKLLNGYEVTINHQTNFVKVQDEIDILLGKFGMQNNTLPNAGKIHALIPGLVSKIFVKKDDKIEIGQKLLILEAMKMENEIDSPVAGVVKNIQINFGDKVEKGELLMEILN